jgi:flagellar biosynthesis/type III secretory pathway M-ring protein FliF/YscJ
MTVNAPTVLAVPEDKVSPGALGFVIVLALGVALFLLIRSMNKQIARIEAPSEEDLKQAEWERRRQEESGVRPPNGDGGSPAG